MCVCVCVYACVRAYVCTCVHECMCACVHTYVHACAHACIRACVHVYVHACVRAYMCVYDLTIYSHTLAGDIVVHLVIYLW